MYIEPNIESSYFLYNKGKKTGELYFIALGDKI